MFITTIIISWTMKRVQQSSAKAEILKRTTHDAFAWALGVCDPLVCRHSLVNCFSDLKCWLSKDNTVSNFTKNHLASKLPNQGYWNLMK